MEETLAVVVSLTREDWAVVHRIAHDHWEKLEPDFSKYADDHQSDRPPLERFLRQIP